MVSGEREIAHAAYDFFPCQFQLWYRASGKTMWYDPIFKVKTLDGGETWRRRHYKVRRADIPGNFFFSVLDNGVTSKCTLFSFCIGLCCPNKGQRAVFTALCPICAAPRYGGTSTSMLVLVAVCC
jgi:hypothetical protein